MRRATTAPLQFNSVLLRAGIKHFLIEAGCGPPQSRSQTSNLMLMSVLGQSLPKWVISATSAFLRIATGTRTSLEVRFVPILLQKSFWGNGLKFQEPLMRPVPRDVRDHIVSHKNDHGPSYRRREILRR
jgi:hypothetical protein